MDGFDPKGEKFSQHISIQCYDTDAAFRLKAEAFMNYAQEIAYRGATQLNFGYDELRTKGTAWVLSRMHFIMNDAPHWRDEVTLNTWHKVLSGPFFLRDFEILDGAGRQLVVCTSSWLVIDTQTRRMVRPDKMEDIVTNKAQCAEDAIEEPCPKIMFPKGVVPEAAGEHRISYSDIDILGHTNNVKYVTWAIDSLDYGEVASRGVKEVFVNFNHETHAGDLVHIFRHLAEDGSWYIEEMVGERCVASVRVVLGQDNK